MLKSRLTSAPVLALPRASGKFIINSEASNGQEDVLHQGIENEVLKPIGYWSRPLCSGERDFDTTHKECSAFVWSVQAMHPFFEGTHIVVLTDH